MSGDVATGEVTVRAARERDIALLYEMFRELAEYEKLLDQLQASEIHVLEQKISNRRPDTY